MEFLLGFVKEITIAIALAVGAAAVRMYLMIKTLVEKADSAEENSKEWQKAHIKALQDISRETTAQTHYLRWLATNSTGREPPPPLRNEQGK